MRLLLTAVILVCVWFSSASAHAEPGDELKVAVITMGPGDPTFSKFGHNALLVSNRITGEAWVYNFGTFSFQSKTLFQDFLKGRLRYWLSLADLGSTLRFYRGQERSVYEQELALPPAMRFELAQSLNINLEPEHRYYKYDHYLDNCSTRVRDALDRVTGGQLRRGSLAPSTQTFRDHTLRLVADDFALYWALNFALGPRVDRPIQVWDEMFLPERLQATLRSLHITTAASAGAAAVERPLVAQERPLYEATRAAPAAERPRRGWAALLVGGLLGAGFAWGLSVRRNHAWLRAIMSLGVAGLSFVLGLLGSAITFFWLATDNEVAHYNENVLQCLPLNLLLALVALIAISKAAWARRLAFGLVSINLGLSVLGVLLKLTPWAPQANAELICFFLPLWLGLCWGYASPALREAWAAKLLRKAS